MASPNIATPAGEFVSPALRCRLCGTVDQIAVAVPGGATNLLKCEACGVGFIDPPPASAFITTHFKEDYITDDVRLELVYGKLRSAALRLVAAQVRKQKAGGRILDIGCAGGYFLDRYFDSAQWEKFGIEPSRYASRRAAARGIKTYQGELLSVKLPAQFFDVITAAGVLPYFRDPQNELRAMRRALKPGGSLVVELPLGATQVWRHATTLGRITGGGSRSIFDSPHLFFYDLPSLRFLLQQTGFQLRGFCPSPGNQQTSLVYEVLFRSYYGIARALSFLTRGGVMLGPGVILSATLVSP